MDTSPRIEITVIIGDQRIPASDLHAAAVTHGMSYEALRKATVRAAAKPIPGAQVGRSPLYATAELARVIADRTGRGAPGRPRPRS